MMLEIQVLALDRHNNVEDLNRLCDTNIHVIFSRISGQLNSYIIDKLWLP
jgi:hypothetical protein